MQYKYCWPVREVHSLDHRKRRGSARGRTYGDADVDLKALRAAPQLPEDVSAVVFIREVEVY